MSCYWWAWSWHFLINYSVEPYEIPGIWQFDFLRLQFPVGQLNSSFCLSLPKNYKERNWEVRGNGLLCEEPCLPQDFDAQDFSLQYLHILVFIYNEWDVNIQFSSQSETDILPWPTKLLVIDISAYVNNFLTKVYLQNHFPQYLTKLKVNFKWFYHI